MDLPAGIAQFRAAGGFTNEWQVSDNSNRGPGGPAHGQPGNSCAALNPSKIGHQWNMVERDDGLLGSRKLKLDRLRQRGVDPYPPRFRRTGAAADAIAEFEASENDAVSETTPQAVALAGRITSMRGMGRATFLDLRDGSGTVQVLLRQNILNEEYELLKDLDIGDFVGVGGGMMRTRTGQVTVDVREVCLLAKGMRPLPEKVARA